MAIHNELLKREYWDNHGLGDGCSWGRPSPVPIISLDKMAKAKYFISKVDGLRSPKMIVEEGNVFDPSDYSFGTVVRIRRETLLRWGYPTAWHSIFRRFRKGRKCWRWIEPVYTQSTELAAVTSSFGPLENGTNILVAFPEGLLIKSPLFKGDRSFRTISVGAVEHRISYYPFQGDIIDTVNRVTKIEILS